MVAGASCPQWGAQAESISEIPLSSVMEQQEPGAECGGITSAVKHPMPMPDTPWACSSQGNFRRDRHLDSSTEELCSCSPLPAEHPRLLAARTVSPSAHMARCLLTSCQTISRVPKEPGLE